MASHPPPVFPLPPQNPGPGMIVYGPEPKWDCATRGPVRPYILPEVLDLLLGLAETYAIIDGTKSDSSRMLSEINSKLDVIVEQVNAISGKLDDVIKMLNDLPRRIRGALNDALVSQSIGQASHRVSQLQSALSNIEVDPATVLHLANDLDALMGGIIGIKGAAAVTVITPFYCAWLPSIVAYQKTMRRRNGPNWKIQSPWKQGSNVATLKESVSTIMTAAYDQDVEYWKHTIPDHTSTYMLTGDGFGWAAGHGEYMFSCPTSSGPELVLQRQGNSFNPIGSGPAIDAWNNTVGLRAEMRAFYYFMPRIWDARGNLLKTFEEPIDLWKDVASV